MIMPKKTPKTMSTKQVLGIVENEGLGYACQYYCDGGEFKDRKLARLWDDAGRALDLLNQYLDDQEEDLLSRDGDNHDEV